MGFQPTEPELHRLGFRTNSPAQPYPTRSYHAPLPTGNWLCLTPRPGVGVACEFTERGVLVAKHAVESLHDLEQSLQGQGRRQLVRLQ